MSDLPKYHHVMLLPVGTSYKLLLPVGTSYKLMSKTPDIASDNHGAPGLELMIGGDTYHQIGAPDSPQRDNIPTYVNHVFKSCPCNITMTWWVPCPHFDAACAAAALCCMLSIFQILCEKHVRIVNDKIFAYYLYCGEMCIQKSIPEMWSTMANVGA